MPPNHPPGDLPLDPAGGPPFPRPFVPPTSKSWLRHWARAPWNGHYKAFPCPCLLTRLTLYWWIYQTTFLLSCSLFLAPTKRDTIRDAILTCARKPKWVSLIYRTETETKSVKQISSEVGLSVNSHVISTEEKRKSTVGRIYRKVRF